MANALMLKNILLLLSLFISLSADRVINETLACPSVLILQKAVQEDMQDALKLEMYAITHGCVVLSRNDSIEALGYDPRNSKEIYQRILYKKTNSELYLLRSSILVEQGGKKNNFRF